MIQDHVFKTGSYEPFICICGDHLNQHQEYPSCGCGVIGFLDAPVKIRYCRIHKAAEELAHACMLMLSVMQTRDHIEAPTSNWLYSKTKAVSALREAGLL